MTAYATLYLANAASVPLEFLQRMVPFGQVSSVPAAQGTAGGYLVSTPGWRMQLKAMPPAQVPGHLQQFARWVGGQSTAAQGLQQRIGETKLVLGCVVEPGFDPSGYARRTVVAIARPGRGLVFADNAVYDADGRVVVGAPGAPDAFLPADLSPAQRWTLATTAIVTRHFGESHELLGGLPVGAQGREGAVAELEDPYEVNDRSGLLEMLKYLGRPAPEKGFAKLAAAVASGTARVTDEVSAEDIEFVRAYGAAVGARGLLADDLGRLVYVAGKGFLAGYLSEAEAWGWALAAAHRLQAAYSSWEEFGHHYLLGVTYRRGVDEELAQAYQELLTDPGSPWKRLPWNTALG